MADWYSTDPRELIDRGSIVVVAPENEVFLAEVDTKHTYCVFFKRAPDKLQYIAEDAEWPPEWKWVRAP